MPYLEDTEDIERYREKFSDIWQSAILTYSTVEVNETQIPNGELKFSRDSREEEFKVLYREGAFSIYEVATNSPFDLLEQVINGRIPAGEEPPEIDSELAQHTPRKYFEGGGGNGRVRESRPKMEVNAAVMINISDDVEQEYSEIIDQLDDQLRRADEPYYDIGRCEGFYFDYIFRANRDHPAILLFANPGINFSISESGTLELVAPRGLFEDFIVSMLPQKPYDEHKGWQIKFEQNQLESLGDGRFRYTEELELDGIEETHAILYLDDERINHIEHITGDVLSENPRYEILQAFDQANNLEGYLKGHTPDNFEVAVQNVLSTAGWFVQWYGDDSFVVPSYSDDVPGTPYPEIDVIAYHPENTQILFIECTNQDISEKEQILDRTEAVSTVLDDHRIPTDIGLFEPLQAVPCVATPQMPEELNDDVVSEFEKKGIQILHNNRLQAIYTASQDTADTVDADTQFMEFV